MSTESEISLIMHSNNIQIIVDKIKSTQNINEFKLNYNTDEKITDIYFDSTLNSLQKKKWALRIRNKNNLNLITLKGPAKYEIHSTSRLENEYEWSEEAFEIIINKLKEIIPIDGKEIGKYFDKNPIKTLQQIGLIEIHTHINNRKIFNVSNANDTSNDVVSEIDIDNITFPLNSNLNSFNVYVINIEIEKKGKIDEDESVLKIITNYLKQEFGTDTVIEWKYGKLALGKGIRKLYKDNKLKDYIDSKGYLKFGALDRIKEYVDEGMT